MDRSVSPAGSSMGPVEGSDKVPNGLGRTGQRVG